MHYWLDTMNTNPVSAAVRHGLLTAIFPLYLLRRIPITTCYSTLASALRKLLAQQLKDEIIFSLINLLSLMLLDTSAQFYLYWPPDMIVGFMGQVVEISNVLLYGVSGECEPHVIQEMILFSLSSGRA